MRAPREIFVMSWLICGFIALIIFTANSPLGDWGNYYYGAKAIGNGHGVQAYEPAYFNEYVSFNETDAGRADGNFFVSYTQVPPFTAVVFRVLNVFPVFTARLVWLLCTSLFCCISLARLFRRLKVDAWWSVGLFVVFLQPLWRNMEQGQSYLLLVALLAEGWLAKENGRSWLAAFLFALSVHLKIFPGIILLWLLLEKNRNVLWKTAVMILALFAASLPLVHWDVWKYYLTEILPRLSRGEINDPWATAYQSMQVFFRQLFVGDELLNPDAWKNSPVLFAIFDVAWKAVVLLGAALFSFDERKSSLVKFSAWLFAGMLLSGYGSAYGLLLLIFPAMAILSSSNSIRRKIILLSILFLVCILPVSKFFALTIFLRFPRLWLTLLFTGGLLWLFRPRWNKRAMAVMLIAVLLFPGIKKTTDNSQYFLSSPALLVHSFLYDEKDIYYVYRDKSSWKKEAVPFPGGIRMERTPEHTPHQVLALGRTLNFPKEQIKDPMIFNDSILLYLSDKNRGPGLYTIRMQRLK